MMDEDEYIEKRVKQQINDFYLPNASLYARWLTVARSVAISSEEQAPFVVELHQVVRGRDFRRE
jgi:hypothetical protein